MTSKSSSAIKENNGSCITTDSNFASKKTCEDFYKEFLRILKLNKDVADFVSAESAFSYETVTLPMGLRNLGMISADLTSCRENYGDERAEIECRLYAAKFYPPGNPDYTEFYGNYIRDMINDVKIKFSGQQGNNPTSVVSQASFSRLSKVLVNLLLKKKPDGTDNIVRRRKAIPGSEVIDSDGNVSYSYYSNEEIEKAEKNAYDVGNAHSFLTLDMEYVPYTYDYLLLTTASLITVKRTERNSSIELPTVEEIFSSDGDDVVLTEQLNELMLIAKRDLDIIDIIESRGGNILDIIHADCKGVDTVKSSDSNLSIREIYMNILMYVRVILYMTIDLIEKVREYGENHVTTSKIIDLILGIETTDTNEYNGFMDNFISYFSDDAFIGMMKELPFMFKINEHLFRILFINLVKRATLAVQHKGSAIVDRFAAHIGYHKNETVLSSVIRGFINSIGEKEGSISDNLAVINSVRGIKEPLVSYAYRTANKYLNTDTGLFGIELAIIDSSVKIVEALQSGKKTTSARYNLFENFFTFDLDSLIETVKKLSGIDSITEDTTPFKNYKTELLEKNEQLNVKRKAISDKLDEEYGRSAPKFYVPLPPIPYDDNERLWAKQKCLELNAHISKIREINPTFNWQLFRDSYGIMIHHTEKFADSDIEDPLLIVKIEESKTTFDSLCKESGLDDSNLQKIIAYEESLLYYSNLDKIKFGFTKFEFDYNKNLGLEMNYRIGKTSIIHAGVVKPIQSILGTPDFVSILDSYFRPFFEPFATVNPQAFRLTFQVVERQVNQKRNVINSQITKENAGQMVTDVVMTAIFFSSENVHECSKFRTKFFSIKDTDRLFLEAKKDLNIPVERTDFSYSEVPEKFRISWDRTVEQNASFSDKTFKVYNTWRGCKEKYPFYDVSGMNTIKRAFEMVSTRYIRITEDKKRRTEQRNNEQNNKYAGRGLSLGPGLGQISEDAKRASEKSSNFWAAMNKDGSSVDSLSVINSVIGSSQDVRKQPSVFGGGFNSRTTRQFGTGRQSVNPGMKMIDQQPGELDQIFTERRGRRKTSAPDPENPEYTRITYNNKTVRGYRAKESPSEVQSGSPSTNRYSKTPSRFQGGLRERTANRDYKPRYGDRRGARYGNDRGNSRDRHSNHGRKSTPSGSSGYRSSSPGNKGTPISKDGTPNSQGRVFTSSPSANKRGGVQIGTQSPGGNQSPNFMQPGPSIFTNLPVIPTTSGTLGFFPTSSPLPNQDGESLFANIAPPTGMFGSNSGRSTPVATGVRGGTDKSDKSEGSRGPPVQIFNVAEDDDTF